MFLRQEETHDAHKKPWVDRIMAQWEEPAVHFTYKSGAHDSGRERGGEGTGRGGEGEKMKKKKKKGGGGGGGGGAG